MAGPVRWHVERILYLKGDFAVFEAVNASGKRAKISGKLPAPTTGTWLWLETRKVEHPKYGKRLEIVRFHGLAPPPEQGEGTLEPWTRVGFSHKSAVWLAERFGRNVERVFDEPKEVLMPGVPYEVLERVFPAEKQLLSALLSFYRWGHTAPTLALVRNELGMEEEAFARYVEQANRKTVVVVRDGRIGLERPYRLEQRIADTLRFRARGRGRAFIMPRDGRLSEEQARVFKLLEQHHVVVLTGGPGTGKTTTSAAVLRSPTAQALSVALVAPTGKAARRAAEASGLEATTIHRLIGLGDGQWAGRPRHHRQNPLRLDLVVVDESSMIDIELMAHLLEALAPSTQLFFIGDADQLPPVGAGSPFADMLDRVPTLRLTKVYRQAATNPIIAGAYAVRSGRMPLPDGELLRLIPIEGDDAPDVVLAEVRRMEEKTGARPQVLTSGNNGALGTRALNALLQQTYNPGAPVIARANGQEIRDGDPVIWTENDYDLGLVNGESGVLYLEKGELVFDTGRGKVVIPATKRRKLLPAYALTVHRSQGSEWPAVVTVLAKEHERLLSREIVYTALTRSKAYHSLIFHPEALLQARSKNAGKRFTWLERLLSG